MKTPTTIPLPQKVSSGHCHNIGLNLRVLHRAAHMPRMTEVFSLLPHMHVPYTGTVICIRTYSHSWGLWNCLTSHGILI